MAKVQFYIVTFTTPGRLMCEDSFQDFSVLSRTELISFLRKGHKFDSIKALDRSDSSNFEFTTFNPKENDNAKV